MRNSRKQRPPRLVVGVTVGASAFSLLRGQLAWFKKQGWDVTLVSSPDEKAHIAAEREGVSFAGIPMSRAISPAKDLIALARWVRVLRARRPDAVNLGTPKAALLGMVASLIVCVPKRVYVVRGLRLEGAKPPLSGLLWAMEWLTMQLATDVVFVSHSLADESKRRHLRPRGKSWIIGAGSSNGVDAESVRRRIADIDRRSLRSSLGFDAEGLVVGYIGRICRDKGVDTLLAAAQSPEWDKSIRLLMVGAIEDDGLHDEMSEMRPKVVHVPWTDDVWAYLPCMDVLCLPSRREGFPNVVLEAGAARVPTVTTRSTGAVDSVISGLTGELFEAGDSDALVLQLNKFAKDPELAKLQGEEAERRVINEYPQDRIWKGYLEIVSGRDLRSDAQRLWV